VFGLLVLLLGFGAETWGFEEEEEPKHILRLRLEGLGGGLGGCVEFVGMISDEECVAFVIFEDLSIEVECC
jgi:hypothetical protein